MLKKRWHGLVLAALMGGLAAWLVVLVTQPGGAAQSEQKPDAAQEPEPGGPPGYSAAVPEGKRLIAIAVDEVAAVGYHVRAGDWVDVIGTRRVDGRNVVCRVAATVQVWAVGTPDQVQEKGARSVTLVVTPRQAEHLLRDGEGGTLRLTLRGNPQGGQESDDPQSGSCW